MLLRNRAAPAAFPAPALEGRIANAESPEPGAPRPLSSGTARVGWVQALPEVLRDLGCDPDRVFGESGFEPSTLDDASAGIAFHAVGELFERGMRATGCPHLALLVAERFDPSVLGETSRQMASSPSVGDALRTLIMQFHLLDEGALPMLLPMTRGRAIFAHSIYARDVPALDQFADLAMGISVRLLKWLCGNAFQPLRVALPHRRPADIAPYQRILGPHVTFNAELAVLVFASAWLDQQVLGGDAVRLSRQRAAVAPEPTTPAMPLSHLVRRALRPMVHTGTATESAVARLFSLHPRSLRRRLATEGETFLGLLNETRLAIAQQLLRDTDLRVAEIAVAMHYSDATALTRAFHAQVGVSPTRWRKRERTRPQGT